MATTPRVRYLRHRQLDRLRYSDRIPAWLAAQATRLTTTVSAVFDALKVLQPREILALANIDLPANTVAPAITGTAQVGQTLTVSTGTWTGVPTPTYTRQWKRGGAEIKGAIGTTYVPTTADIGATITCTVKATNPGGSVSITTAATAAVIAA